jgi:hypothetical protein
MQFFRVVSSGSPQTSFSLGNSVSDVLNTIAAPDLSNPCGIPSPGFPSRNSYATPGRITLSTQPFNMAGGCPHQLGCTMTMPSASEI